MKYIISTVFFLHGAIHLMGFAKGFNLAQFEEMPADISRMAGLFWLLAFLLFLASGITYYTEKGIWPFLAVAAVVVSSILIWGMWSDAKFGMIPNVAIITLVVVSLSACNFNRMITQETKEMLEANGNTQATIISEESIRNLPAPVFNWIKNTGIVGKPAIRTVWVSQSALMKMKPQQQEWYPAEAEQWVTIEEPAFIWTVSMRMSPLLQIRGRDKFTGGKGEMLIRINSLINVVNEKGPQMDEGTLQRFLGEIVWYPSSAISPYIEWEAIDDFSAIATMSYMGVTGSGTFYFNEQGDFVRFVALRYMGNKPDAKKYPWEIRVEDYAVFDGVKVPSRMQATWKLDDGDWTWLKLLINEIKYEPGVL